MTVNNSEKMVERMKMVKAMEFIMRCVNDEEVFEPWLAFGVADGDIDFGDLSVDVKKYEDDEAFWYAVDEGSFAELMQLFLRRMKGALKSGGLYCGGVVSK